MKKLLSLMFLLISSLSYCFTSINPTIFDKRIDDGGAVKEYYVSNPTNSEIGYRIYVEPSDGPNDMSKWIEYYPTSLKLKAGETKKIKVFVESPKDVKEGEYTAILGVKEIAIPMSLKSENAGVSIYTDLKLEIAGFVGDLKPEIEISDLEVTDNKVKFGIKNIGKIRTKVEAYLESADNEPLYLGSFRLLQNKFKSFDSEVDLTKYKKDVKFVVYDLENNKLYEKQIKK